MVLLLDQMNAIPTALPAPVPDSECPIFCFPLCLNNLNIWLRLISFLLEEMSERQEEAETHEMLIAALEAKGVAFERLEHAAVYPFCSPIIFYDIIL